MLNKINLSSHRQKLIVYLALTVVTFAVFWQVNRFDFINFDDPVYVTENSYIQSGITLAGIRWALSTTHAEFWHPLTWLSLMLDYQLVGLNAGGYHITNLILHILSALLLFWLFNRMTGAIWKSAFVAAFFAVHPLHVESVAWIAERKDVLSAFFWMLTLCLYVYYTEKPVIKRYLPVVSCFVLALLSKPMVVTLPVIMILLDYWPLKRFEFREVNFVLWQLKEKMPFFILSAFFSIITLFAQYNSLADIFPLSSRIANASISFVIYLEKTFWPRDLAVFYPFPAQIPLWQVSGAVLLIIVISAAVIVMAKRLPYLFVGWLWYAITLLPVIGIIQVGDFAMADRYTYLPLIGIAVGLAWGIPFLMTSTVIKKIFLFPTAISVLIILSILTTQQCGYWKNSITIFNHALQVTINNALAHNNIAPPLVEEGEISKAIDHYDKAIGINPNYSDAYSNRGNAYARLGQYQRAIEDYDKAIRLKHDFAVAYYNMGTIKIKIGLYQEAIDDFSKAIRLKPDNAGFFYNRGIAYFKLGMYRSAVDDFNEAIHLKPDYTDAYNNRGGAYFKLDRYQKAIDDFNETIRLKPDNANAYNNLARLLLKQNHKESGCYDAKQACNLGNCKALQWAKERNYCH